jgi:hypothetical protein
VYRVSVVQIESRTPRRLAQPVQTRHLFATTVRRPEVVEVYRTPAAPGEVIGDIRVALGEEITILGRNFLGTRTWVRLGPLDPIRVLPDTPGRIHIALPDNAYPIDPEHATTRPIPQAQQIQPGALAVQVIVEHDVESVTGGLDRGQTTREPRSYRSNVGMALVVPVVTGIVPASGTAATILTVNGTRLHRSDGTTQVLIGDAAIDVRPPEPGDPWAAPTPTAVQVPLATLPDQLTLPPPTGKDLSVRVQVNGAQSTNPDIPFRWMP